MNSWHSLVLPYILADIHTFFLFKSLSVCQKTACFAKNSYFTLHRSRKPTYLLGTSGEQGMFLE